jgi:biopolymer transport protein TolR
MTRRETHGSQMMAEINITPFTDVVLVLLIIFMLATPIIVGSALKVHVPKALTSKPDEEKFMIVSIDNQEILYVNDRKISIDELTKSIQDSAKQGSKIMLRINGDKSIKYRTVIKVIRAARDAGVVRYLLMTEKIEGGDTGGPKRGH